MIGKHVCPSGKFFGNRITLNDKAFQEWTTRADGKFCEGTVAYCLIFREKCCKRGTNSGSLFADEMGSFNRIFRNGGQIYHENFTPLAHIPLANLPNYQIFRETFNPACEFR